MKERRGYHRAFARRFPVVFMPLPAGEPLAPLVVDRALEPVLVLEPDIGVIPGDIASLPWPTARLFVDTFVGTKGSLPYADLFDYAFVFHPGFIDPFRQRHPRATLLAHAAESDLFADDNLFSARGGGRDLDVGWVGEALGPVYAARRRCLAELTSRFSMNDVRRRYSHEELASIYGRSKIVVNVSRDDHLSDANLRCFEAMAAGALLITIAPTELSELGLVAGEHYVAAPTLESIPDLVAHYLEDESHRTNIALAGRRKTLAEHTYDRRVDTILALLEADGPRRLAPVRGLSHGKQHALQAYYHAMHGNARPAIRNLLAATWRSPVEALKTTRAFARLAVRRGWH